MTGEGAEILRHLVTDLLLKGLIVVAAVALMVFGAVLIRRKSGR
ncbi:hypothetical protein [Amycolatopsis panacis]|nr:hypothetical protein [Amycolatopsis panacis]